jgi:hypothetical protein
VKFEMNWAQERLFDSMHHQNAIQKARQLGFTTFIQLFMLDACVFNSNVRAGTIAHNLEDAKAIFRDKVKYPYDNLPEQIRAAVAAVSDSASELMLSNNSSLRVATSHRSGTLNCLHISEYGKLRAKYPEKAREVRTGALNTVQAGQVVFVESTAEGQEGHFFQLWNEAQALQRPRHPRGVLALLRQARGAGHQSRCRAEGLVRQEGDHSARGHEARVPLDAQGGVRGERGRRLLR